MKGRVLELKEFDPIEIVLESKEEAEVLWHLSNMPMKYCIDYLKEKELQEKPFDNIRSKLFNILQPIRRGR